MRKAILTFVLAAASVTATQVFHMNLYEALCFTDDVYVVRIDYVYRFHMDYMDRIEYYMEVIDVVHGEDPPQEELLCAYSMMLPSCTTDENGNEIWESPLVSGSGNESAVSEGDTLIVLTSHIATDSTRAVSVVRIESLDSMDEIIRILEEEFQE